MENAAIAEAAPQGIRVVPVHTEGVFSAPNIREVKDNLEYFLMGSILQIEPMSSCNNLVSRKKGARMLYSIDKSKEKEIEHMPHEKEFNAWKKKLTDEEFKAICEKINGLIEGTKVQVASWMPGKDWKGTVYEPIYSKACNKDFERSALFFGLIVWKCFLDHPDAWSFERYPEISKGMVYFKINPPD